MKPRYCLLIILTVVLDRLVKMMVVSAMEVHESKPLLEGVFHITLIHNTGAAFSSFEGQRYLLIAVTTACLFLGFVYLFKRGHKHDSLFTVALCMILGGGIGNLIDRILLGYVVDMFDFRVFPVFNVADIFVTVGCVLLAIDVLYLIGESEEEEEEPSEESDGPAVSETLSEPAKGEGGSDD